MKNLNIEQSTDVENVSSVLVDKLYRLAFTASLAGLSINLTGNLFTTAAYEDAVKYLNSTFPGLTINVQDGNYYIRFTDPKFEEIAIKVLQDKNIGDGIGVTQKNMDSLTTITNEFNSLDIKTLVDLKHLKSGGAISIPGDFNVPRGLYVIEESEWLRVFGSSYTNATVDNPIYSHEIPLNIELPNGTAINVSGGCSVFSSTSNKAKITIDSIKWNNSTVTPTNNAFSTSIIYRNCLFNWDDSFIPNQTDFSKITIFRNCFVDKIIFREGITVVSESLNVCKTNYLVYPSTILNVNDFYTEYRRDSHYVGIPNNTGAIVFKSVNPPNNIKGGTFASGFRNKPQYIYVPDGSVNTYKTSTIGVFAELEVRDKITAMSEMPQSLKEQLGITDEDINRV